LVQILLLTVLCGPPEKARHLAQLEAEAKDVFDPIRHLENLRWSEPVPKPSHTEGCKSFIWYVGLDRRQEKRASDRFS